MKKPAVLLVGLALAVGVAGCGGSSVASTSGATKVATGTPGAAVASTSTKSTATKTATAVASYADALTVSYDDTDLDASWSKTSSSFITLADGTVRFDGAGATANGNKVTITQSGTYVVSGTSTDAQIVVDTKDAKPVRLVLSGANLTCSTSAPIYVTNAKTVVLILADGTQNSVTDGANYTLADSSSDEPNAAIFSKADLTINGTGSLTVTANYKDGITSKDDLKLVSGTITVTAADDALTGKDSLGVKDATVTIQAEGDGLKSTNDVDPSKGYVDIAGGTLSVASGDDGIQAQTTLLVSGGSLTVVAGGGSANAGTTADAGTKTSKGLKAASGIFIEDGQVKVDAADDAIHSTTSVTINGGTVSVASGHQGIQSDESIVINGGEVEVTKSSEGIESYAVTVNDGSVRVCSSANGFNNSVGATKVSGAMGLFVTGGYVYIDADGDGIDTNDGVIDVSGGTVVINGPAGNTDGALDYGSECKVTGGLLLAVGSSGMAEPVSDSSSQYSIMVNFDQAQAAGTIVHIQAEDGSDVLTFAPTKQYQSVVFSSALLKKDATYAVFVGGTATGTITDGLYAKATYSPGTQYTSLTLSSVVTTSGNVGRGGGNQGGGGPGGNGMPRGGPGH